MELSIIIVNRNTREMLEACLHSIQQTQRNLKIQIIIVDNASTDDSKDMVGSLFPEIHWLDSGGNVGFAKANNIAIPSVVAPFVLFLNPDTIVKENALSMMVNFLKTNPSVGAVGCKMKNLREKIQELPLQMRISPLAKFIDLLFLSDKIINHIRKFLPCQNPDQSGYVSSLSGACLMIRNAALAQVGSFDERFFMYSEDADLCHRLNTGGWKLYYLHEAEIVHIGGGATDKSTDFGIRMMCESAAKLMEKYHGNAGRKLYLGVVLIGAHIKLIMTLFFKIAGYVSVQANRMISEQSIHKHVTMIKWSLAWERPKAMRKQSIP